jgi:small subunit ribosomal protein S1
MNSNIDNIEELYKNSLKKIKEGDIIKGKIIHMDKNSVMVDIGYKSEGVISIQEFFDEDGNVGYKVGDEIDVLVEKRESGDGSIILSKEKADKLSAWNRIINAWKSDMCIEGKILNRVKGGFIVDVGLKAFLPGSQIDIHPISNFDEFIGKKFVFKVLKFDRNKENIVLSRKAILEKEREELRRKTLESIVDGMVVKGVIKNITDYGIFIDIGGIDGLLHITDISWGRVENLNSLFKNGDELNVKILKYDRESNKLSLGLKQITPDPWKNIEERYKIGDRVKGKVVNIVDYGAFIELEEGIEGLIHHSDISWTKIRHPSEVLSIGDLVEVAILNIDTTNRKMSLGLKHVEPSPWDIIEEKHPIGSIIEGPVKNITDFGIFVEIDRDIDGMIHISDISWTKRIKHPSDIYKRGDKVKAVVLNIDKKNKKISLGIKQLEKDPWEEIKYRYRPGDNISGKVTNITDFGIFIEIGEGIEGLIHISEISDERIKNISNLCKLGDIIEAKILDLNISERRMALSIKALEKEEQEKYLKEFLEKGEKSSVTIGEIIGKKSKKRKK